ncbi:hypothetical protein KEJ37_01900 [Candidatus Bathyarchaeota archaeon]|nr:hypothetical protein [Candidatus Bathyarchaeota archaeon]
MVGDINADGKVDMKEVAAVSKAFGSVYIPGQGYMHPTPCSMCPYNPRHRHKQRRKNRREKRSYNIKIIWKNRLINSSFLY